jgi:hypothetical protein
MVISPVGIVNRELDLDDARPWSKWYQVAPSIIGGLSWEGELLEEHVALLTDTLPSTPGAFEYGVTPAGGQVTYPVLRGKATGGKDMDLRNIVPHAFTGPAPYKQRAWVLERVNEGCTLHVRVLVGTTTMASGCRAFRFVVYTSCGIKMPIGGSSHLFA